MSPGLRILALVPDAFGDAYGALGGIALYNRDLLTAACEHPGVEKVVVLPRLMPAPPAALPANLDHVTSGLGGKGRYLAAVLAQAVRGRFDLVFCGHLNLLPAAFLTRVARRAPIVAFLYGIEAWTRTPRRSTNALLRYVSTFVTIREFTLECFLSWSKVRPEHTFLLETAIHLEQYGAGPKEPALLARYALQDRRVLMTTARLDEPYKGIDEVIQVLPQVIDTVPDVAYLVVGGGPDRERLEAKARGLGVHERVVFSGPVDEAEKAAHLRLADAFVMAGTGFDFDRYPLRYAFLEALACGIPIVAARPEGPGECDRPPSTLNILVDPHDPASLREGILAALNQPRGEHAQAAEAFSYERFRARVHEMLDVLGASPAQPPVTQAGGAPPWDAQR